MKTKKRPLYVLAGPIGHAVVVNPRELSDLLRDLDYDMLAVYMDTISERFLEASDEPGLDPKFAEVLEELGYELESVAVDAKRAAQIYKEQRDQGLKT